ncbi:BQ2448_2116 [Microbotryum intermedium]|uniref:BQ2448_2116 protein n=1 Tax=Microbotryum intermedium TaxID=269621 RepID=A0A238FDC8_9BASI|nr:BQ2448_2116 [Microbotryum intermedium]
MAEETISTTVVLLSNHTNSVLLSLFDQILPSCLQYCLGDEPCAHENCAFSHAYSISKDKLDTPRRSLLATPCAQSLKGAECALGDTSFVAHVNPRGWNFFRQGCAFPSLHPALSSPYRFKEPYTTFDERLLRHRAKKYCSLAA